MMGFRHNVINLQTFRQQAIDGSTLLLLTERHLVEKLCMKLGPALKLRSALAEKTASCPKCFHCQHCHQDDEHSQKMTKHVPEAKRSKPMTREESERK